MKGNRLFTLRILVGLSLLLLLGFLSFWNTENYKTEKFELIQDLTNSMSLACSDYRDQVVKDIFRIVKVNNKNGLSDESIPNSFSQNDFIVNVETGGTDRFHKQSPFKKAARKMELPDSILQNLDSLTNISIDYVGGTEGKEDKIVIWHSSTDSVIKMDLAADLSIDTTIIWGMGESHRFSNTNLSYLDNMPGLYNKIDSLFALRLESSGIQLEHAKVKILSAKDSMENAIFIPFDYETLGFNHPPVAVFKNFQTFIFKKMISSLLLSLLLFSIVTITFYVVMKSWAAQLRLTKLKNEFISNMTHELNTPIATIGVAIEAMENYGAMNDPVKSKEYLSISKHELGRLKTLVDKVLKISEIESNDNELSKEPLDFKMLVEHALKNLKLHFEKSNVSITTDFANKNYSVFGDKVHLTNLLHNVIDNAIKYSPENPIIKLSLDVKEEIVNFKISDQGIGIPKAYQDKIFDRFFRVPKNDTHNVKGHGLGLHYVKTILEQHAGSINVVSKENEGTTLIIQIPKQND